ncbi:hypothetical protein [Vagococcus fluvialis]|uniref:hypothetical protein n=1 Tax=Vagococcus fluvialis TaxID=2738 RepID=UPI0037A6445F
MADGKVTINYTRKKNIIGLFWWSLFKFYCFQQAIFNIDVPEEKRFKALDKAHNVYVDGKVYHRK